MSRFSRPNTLAGASLQDIILNAALWSTHFDLILKEGSSALSELHLELQKIDGPIARARECHVLLAIAPLEDASKIVEHEDHPLCKAMHLLCILGQKTPASYLFVIQQPATLFHNPNDPMGREGQMRWDFVLAQGFQLIGQTSEALVFYGATRRLALELGVRTMARVCDSAIESLSSHPEALKISMLKLQLQDAKDTQDVRAINSISNALCIQYAKMGDHSSLLSVTENLLPGLFKSYLALGAELLSGKVPQFPDGLPLLDRLSSDAFPVMAYTFWHFKQLRRHRNLFRDRRSIEHLVQEILRYPVPADMDYSRARLITFVLQIVTFILTNQQKRAVEMLAVLDNAKGDFAGILEFEHYHGLVMSYIELKKEKTLGAEMCEKMEGLLLKNEDFGDFVRHNFPEIIYTIGQKREWDVPLDKILVVTRHGCFLGKNELNGFPKTEALKEAIDFWGDNDYLDTNHYQVLSRYARKLRTVDCDGVVVDWEKDGTLVI